MSNEIEKLLNIGEMAKELGVNRTYISAMKRAGFSMPGGRSTARAALNWLKTAPQFAVTKPRRDASNQQASASDKQHAQSPKRVRHTA